MPEVGVGLGAPAGYSQTLLLQKELEAAWRVPVFDRFTVVLHIFRCNARTKEARLQVALAELPLLRYRPSVRAAPGISAPFLPSSVRLLLGVVATEQGSLCPPCKCSLSEPCWGLALYEERQPLWDPGSLTVKALAEEDPTQEGTAVHAVSLSEAPPKVLSSPSSLTS